MTVMPANQEETDIGELQQTEGGLHGLYSEFRANQIYMVIPYL